MAEADAPLSVSPSQPRVFAARTVAGTSVSSRSRPHSCVRSGSAVPPSPPALPSLSRHSPPDEIDPPAAVPTIARQTVLDGLRSIIATIERGGHTPSFLPSEGAALGQGESPTPRLSPNPSAASRQPLPLLRRSPRWDFGDDAVDRWLGEDGLGEDGLVEIKPASYGDGTAAAVLAIGLAVRRLRLGATEKGSVRPILWCRPANCAREMGRLYAPGLPALGLNPQALILAETTSSADTLWAMEEGLRSGAAGLVLGWLDDVALTPARRLALAAQAHRTPALLLTAARSTPAPTTRSRWRISRRRAAPHPFDPQAPGAPRLGLVLERCRGRRADLETPSFVVEWCHDTHRFRVVADVADRAHETARRA